MRTKSSFLARLREGIPSDELQSPIEAMALPVHGINILLLGGLIITFSITDYRFDGTGIWGLAATLGGLLLSGVLARRYCHPRIAAACEALGVMGLNGLLVVSALALVSTTGLPLVDELLLKADAAMGFHWREFMTYFENKESLLYWLHISYSSIQLQPTLLIILLCVQNQTKNSWTFLNAWIISLVATLLFFPFFPAVAALNYYHIPQQPGAHVADFYPIMSGLRSGELKTIGQQTMRGMVTFPSFHAASAICLGWGYSKLNWVRWPFILLNLVMLLATIVIGGHYLIDVIAGVLIAGGAIWISHKYIRTLPAHSRQIVAASGGQQRTCPR